MIKTGKVGKHTVVQDRNGEWYYTHLSQRSRNSKVPITKTVTDIQEHDAELIIWGDPIGLCSLKNSSIIHIQRQ